MTVFPMNHLGRYCCLFGTCELCVAAEADAERRAARDAELHPVWLAFLAEHGLTPEQVADARARAVAKMHEPRQRWRVVIVENPASRHHLTAATPDPVARGLETFLARYTDDDLGAMLVDLVVSLRAGAAHQRWVDDVMPGAPDFDEAYAEHLADVADRVARWRAELTTARRP